MIMSNKLRTNGPDIPKIGHLASVILQFDPITPIVYYFGAISIYHS